MEKCVIGIIGKTSNDRLLATTIHITLKVYS